MHGSQDASMSKNFLQQWCPFEVEAIIDRFVQDPDVDADLRDFAAACRSGDVP